MTDPLKTYAASFPRRCGKWFAALPLLAIALALAGCQPASPASQPTSPPADTATPLPVSGFIRIENGEDVVQGVAGQALQVTVHFGAKSLTGSVTQMRASQVPDCSKDMSNAAPWEPYAPQKVFTIPNLPSGITPFNVSVQYQDAPGESSPFYCENGAVEGVAPSPSPG